MMNPNSNIPTRIIYRNNLIENPGTPPKRDKTETIPSAPKKGNAQNFFFIDFRRYLFPPAVFRAMRPTKRVRMKKARSANPIRKSPPGFVSR
jgi:hypothetical protein